MGVGEETIQDQSFPEISGEGNGQQKVIIY